MNPSLQPKLTLNDNEIHLWVTTPLQCIDKPDLFARYKDLLTEDEIKRQERYIFEDDRRDALITRAFIRDLLSFYADIAPENWRFKKGEKGKPEIIDAPIPLRFNLSHTKKMIICAVTLENDIGCDVENIKRENDVLEIAHRYFSDNESEELFSLPESKQRSRFFDYWTLKESYIKACGLGLAIPLKDFSFHIEPATSKHYNENIQLSVVPERNDNPDFWKSWLFYPSDEHRVALSIKSLNTISTERQSTPYKIRFFNSTPLLSMQEISWF